MMGGQVKNRKNRMKSGTENRAENRAEGSKAKKGAHKWMNIRLYFIVLILTVGVLVMGILLGIFDMLDQVFYVRYGIVTLLWLILLSVLISGLVTTFLTNRILQPIRRLGRAMGEVARGDFQVRLETGSRVGEVQEIYEHFNQMAGELAATEMLQRDFVSNVSHEFKTPINAIEGYAMLLQGGCAGLRGAGRVHRQDPFQHQEAFGPGGKYPPFVADGQSDDPPAAHPVSAGRTDSPGGPSAGA